MSITVLLFNILYVSEHYQLQSTSINCTVRNPGGILESFFSFKSNSVAHTVDSCSRTHVIFTNFFPLPLCMLVPQSCLTLQYHGLGPVSFLCPWDFPGKNTGVGCHSFLQGIFLTQGSNLNLPHCRQSLYSLSHLGRLSLPLTATLLKVTAIHLLP